MDNLLNELRRAQEATKVLPPLYFAVSPPLLPRSSYDTRPRRMILMSRDDYEAMLARLRSSLAR